MKVRTFYSDAKVLKGKFELGEQVIEKEHVFHYSPLRVFINADYPNADRSLLHELEKTIEFQSSFYEQTSQQSESDLVLYLLRPKREKDSNIYSSTRDGLISKLPQSKPGLPPEVWILAPTETLLYENLKIPFADPKKGIPLLSENLLKIAKIREFKKLASSEKQSLFQVQHVLINPVSSCESEAECLETEKGKYYKKSKPLPMSSLEGRTLKKGQILTYILTNLSENEYYAYLINASADGSITPLWPPPENSAQTALIQGKQVRDLSQEVWALLGSAGEEMMKLIVSQYPIDITLLKQSAFRNSRSGMNPLERLLFNTQFGASRGEKVHVNNEQWGSSQFTFQVSHE